MTKKLIVILGPTASGKSELAIKLAKKFKGEIVSADSRQVYTGMDIGTGKVTKEEMRGISHYLLDVASPKRRFTVVQYRKLALEAIDKIHKKNKVPFLVGGTGFYIQSVVDGIVIPEVRPDWKLRKDLEKKSTQQLFNLLKKLDPKRTRTIEQKNRRRLIRALEIIIKTRKPIPPFRKRPLPYPTLMVGIKKSSDELKKLIKKRLLKRLKQGLQPTLHPPVKNGPLITEVKRLKKSSLSWKRLEEFGLEYRYLAKYLQGKLNYQEMMEKLQKESEHFTKRQMTWFKRDKRINWIKNHQEAEKLIKKFLENK